MSMVGYAGWFDPEHYQKRHGGEKKERAPFVGRIKPFKNSIKWLVKQPADKWLCKEVTIRYFHDVSFEFTGQISCIGSNGQLRLQFIEFPEYDTKNEYEFSDYIEKTHHSFWFHYKDIIKVTHEDRDITYEILDLLQMKIAELFIFYWDYKLLHRDHVPKLARADFEQTYLRQLIDLDFNYTDFIDDRIDLLFDINRTNKHLILKTNTYLGEQRRCLSFSNEDMSQIINNWKDAFIKQMKSVIKIVKKRDEQRKKGLDVWDVSLDDLKVEEVDDKKKGWQTYLDWDEKEVCDLVKKELERTKNEFGKMEFELGTRPRKLMKKTKERLFNLKVWGKPVPRPYIHGIPGPHRTSHSITWKLHNKLESAYTRRKWMDKREKNRKHKKTLKHNEVTHIGEYRKMKRKKLKKKRQEWRLDMQC